MSIKVFDISPKLIDYLLGKSSLTDLVGQRVYAGAFPLDKSSTIDTQPNPKVMLRQDGGDLKSETYRYKFICRAETLQEAKELAVIVTNLMIEENFSLQSDGGESLAYYAELEGSLIDSVDENTGNPEVFFNINFISI
jgi:hypothetical protein